MRSVHEHAPALARLQRLTSEQLLTTNIVHILIQIVIKTARKFTYGALKQNVIQAKTVCKIQDTKEL